MPDFRPSPDRASAAPEYRVVGQGLAGSVLALSLLEAGRRVRVLAWPGGAGASRAALGVVNPITGLRFTPSYRWPEAQPAAIAFYQRWETHWGEQIWFPAPIYRHFTSPAEAKRWDAREAELPDDTSARTIVNSPWSPFLNEQTGGIQLQGGGWLDFPRFLDLARAELLARGCLTEAAYAPDTAHEGLTVFCDGYTGLCENPFLADLPRRSAQGEVLLLRAPELAPAAQLGIVQCGVFLVPTREPGLWRAGANYAWQELHGQPSTAGREYVERVLRRNFRFDWEVVDHLAGVRPILTDKLPVLGALPGRPGFAVLNGLASKGALLAPWAADLLIAHLERTAPLPVELDVKRNFPL